MGSITSLCQERSVYLDGCLDLLHATSWVEVDMPCRNGKRFWALLRIKMLKMLKEITKSVQL